MDLLEGLVPSRPLPEDGFSAVEGLPLLFQHYKSRGRVWAMQLLYQMEATPDGFGLPPPEEFWDRLAVVTGDVAPKEARRSRRFAERLVAGVMAEREAIDSLIASAATGWSVARMDPVDRNAMRLAIWEMMQGETPARVCIDDAVEIAKTYGAEKSWSFVNGVLDALAANVPRGKRPGAGAHAAAPPRPPRAEGERPEPRWDEREPGEEPPP